MQHLRTQKQDDLPEISRTDLIFATLLFGFFLGFGYFACLHAVAETRRTRRLGAYIILCWLGLLVSFGFSLTSWLLLDGVIPAGFWVYFWILIFWAIQINCLLQITVNRVCILITDPRKRFRLKFFVALIVVTINISVFVIWIPACLQVNDTWQKINRVWDRCEKCLFLLIDGYLNWLFIRTVQTRLIDHGLSKYNRLLKFNKIIIVVSMALDFLTIGLMSLPNGLVFVQFQSLSYLIKLEIEMATSQLIVKVATSTGIHVLDQDPVPSTSAASTSGRRGTMIGPTTEVSVHTQVVTKHDDAEHHELRDSKHWKGSSSPDLAYEDDASVKRRMSPV